MEVVAAYRLDTMRLFVSRVRFSPDGKRIAGSGGAAGEAGCLVLWDVEVPKPSIVRRLERETVAAMEFSPDGNVVASSCWPDNEVHLWNLPDLEVRAKLTLSPNNPPRPRKRAPKEEAEEDDEDENETVVSRLAFSRDGKTLAAGCWDLKAKTWDLAT
ncbi:MAG: WD40 repeat domain-containing protein, partial [Gemmatimonadota bacterium]|nr:WD40 repeat domain-containing protein [Gemmatimonadota bacterium]